MRLVFEKAHPPALVGGSHHPHERANGSTAFALRPQGLFDGRHQRFHRQRRPDDGMAGGRHLISLVHRPRVEVGGSGFRGSVGTVRLQRCPVIFRPERPVAVAEARCVCNGMRHVRLRRADRGDERRAKGQMSGNGRGKGAAGAVGVSGIQSRA